MERVAENLARTKLKADLVIANVLEWQDERQFDAVLLDAPCSATGTIRRHPDLPFAKDGTGISELIGLQAEMLSAAARRVKPGGRLVFCTCSLIPDEGEVQAESFLKPIRILWLIHQFRKVWRPNGAQKKVDIACGQTIGLIVAAWMDSTLSE